MPSNTLIHTVAPQPSFMQILMRRLAGSSPGSWFKSRFMLLLALLAAALLQAGCASTLRSDVTTFQRWPADAEGSTFDFRTDPKHAQDLEYQSYQQHIADALQLQGLQLANPGEKPRFWVDFDYDTATRRIQFQEPIFDDRRVWIAPVWIRGVGWRGGYWAYDPFGPSVIGHRTVERDIQVQRLKLEINDGERRVFEGRAQTNDGDSRSISVVMPYLIRSIFADFPGQDGRTRTVEFDTKTRAHQALSISIKARKAGGTCRRPG